jgi:predicted lipoprotein with Yx(FWY)xxD motif
VKTRATLVVVPLCALLVAACGSSSAPTKKSGHATAAAVKISTATLPSVGTVLVNAQGRTLYIFVPDDAKAVTCVAACAENWPPATLSSGQRPVAGGQVKQSLLGQDSNPTGSPVVTYAHWPLYTYDEDVGPGDDSGQAVDQDGGDWYVISPSGTVIKKKG